MRSPSASARRSARASRIRVRGSPVRAHDKKVHPMGTLVAFISSAVSHGVSVVTSLLRQRR